jgi:competence protein ComEC
MIDFTRAPVARFLVPLAGGSLVGYLGSPAVRPGVVLFSCLVLWLALLLIDQLFREKPLLRGGLFSSLVFGLVFCTGLGLGMMDEPKDPGLPVGERIMISGKMREGPVERNGRLEYEMGLSMVLARDTAFQTATLLKAYMQVPRDSPVPVAGETWRLGGRLVAIRNSGNPGEIDYAAILKRKNCWYRFYCDTVPELNYRLEETQTRNLSAVRIRNGLSESWEGPPEALSLLRAVCLGDRSGLSETMRQSYSLAGGMHVLAVSGLHVGLIWWVLHRVFSFLVRLLRREIYRVVLITLLLWFYAYVTGFSSSVCRSVTMFSFISAARLIHHRGHPVNALLVSMFFLVVIHPGRLLDVGFQLSYAAVLSIVTLHPVLKNLVRVKNRILKWAWEATGISLAAQIGTIPLVVYYFHQVPVYALLTNLVAIPLLSCIITLFVFSVPLMAIGTVAGIMNRLLMTLAGLMNSAMEAIASIPGSVIGGLFLDPVCALLFVVLVFLGITMFSGKSSLPKYICMFTLSLILIQSARIRSSRLRSFQLVVGHFYNGSLVTFREGLYVDHYIWSGDPESVAYMDRYLASAWGQRSYEISVVWVNGAAPIDTLSGRDVAKPVQGGISACYPLCYGTWMVGNQKHRGLVATGTLDGVRLGILTGIDTEFLLLSGEPPLSPKQMDDLFLGSRDVILDGSSRGWYMKQVAHWKDQMDHGVGQIHITGEQGAYHHWK